MNNVKLEIADKIASYFTLEKEFVLGQIELPKDIKNGDFAFPCFRLSKELKKSPVEISKEIEANVKFEGISKIESVNGYINFFLDKVNVAKEVLQDIYNNKENYGNSSEGRGKNVVIDYSAPNIAKPFHIGHLRSTVIGRALYNIYTKLGYRAIGVNYLGDWGTQFGLLIEGYKRWGSEYDLEECPIDSLMAMYVRINNLAKEDEEVKNLGRENFKKLEQGDEECYRLWKWFRDISLEEFEKIYEILGCKFDSYNGEAFAVDKIDAVIDILREKNLLKNSDGAEIVDLEKYEMSPLLVIKSNESTTYAARDLATMLYRLKEYNPSKLIYVTSYEQILHFKQLFKVAELMELKNENQEMYHVPFGMIHLKSGRMSTRKGNVVFLDKLISDAINKVKFIIKEKNPNLENQDEIARKVGVGAICFSDLKNNRIKDEIFDLDEILKFEGETGPYVQYTYVRTQSILRKAIEQGIEYDGNVDFSVLNDNTANYLIKLLSEYADTIKESAKSFEPSIITRYIIEIAKAFSSFYNNNKIICEENNVMKARLLLTYCVGVVLKDALALIGIECPDQM